MGAYLALGKAYGLHQRFERIELERGQSEILADYVYHPLIFRRTGGGVFVEILVRIPFEALNPMNGQL